MAKKQKPTFNYPETVATLKKNGPQRLYLLFGPEDYLRERFLDELRALCVAEADAFSFKRLDGPAIDLSALAEAVNALPFFSERTMVEVRGCDINKFRDAETETLKGILGDIPDFCTLAFVCDADNAPDGRLGAVRLFKKLGCAIEFAEQDGGTLAGWAAKRFKALGKDVSRADVEYLMFLSGSRMNALIPEIEKAAAYAAGAAVTRADIDATASRIPEADVFRMIDLLAARRPDEAAALLSDLLADKANHPIALNALIGQQMRRLYAAKLCAAAGTQRAEAMELSGVRYDFLYDKLLQAAQRYSAAQLGGIVALCAAYDFKMKSTGLDADVLIRELFGRIAAGGS